MPLDTKSRARGAAASKVRKARRLLDEAAGHLASGRPALGRASAKDAANVLREAAALLGHELPAVAS